jgi:uncharacterized repeat protein (TIGR01451 family)
MNASSLRLTAPRARFALALAAALLIVLAGARSASAATDPNAPGPFKCSSSFAFTTMLPSLFQGADGDQCDSTGALTTPGSYDWQKLVADGKFGAGGGGMTRIDDDTVPGSIYKDGSQEFGPLGWDYDANLGGQKTNLLAAWGYPDQLTDLYLYLAFAATDAPGTVRYGFELNRLAAVPSGTSAVNHPNYFLNSKGHWVLKRTLDDVLIIFNWQGGAAATIERCYWKPESGPNPPPIHEAGIWSGCQDLTALAEAQGRGNGDGDKDTDDTITNFLPGLAADELAENQFGELAVNLTDALDVGGANQPKCLSFGSFWMKTLPGNSLNSSLKDLIPPHPVSISNCGKVIVRKDTTPSTDTTSFDFDGAGFKAEADGQQAGSPADFDLSHGQSETIDKIEPSSALPAGTDYTVTENLPAGFTLQDIACTETGASVATTTPSVKDVANRTVTLKVDPGETVDCTFKNRKQGTILIDKDQVGGADSDAFSFTRGGDLAAGSFTQSESEAGPEAISVVPNLGAGGDTSKTYTITEDATGQPAGYGLKDVTCYDGGSTSDPVDTDRVVSGQSVDVKVAAGETVLCVFENVKTGTILIDKDQVGGADSDAFSFTRGGDLGAGSFTQSESEAGPESISVVPNLGAGSSPATYTVTEDATGQPSGYDFKDLTCHDGSTTSAPADTDRVITGQSADVKVAAGETVLCVYRNVKRATILVAKDQVGGSNADVFTFTAGGDLTPAGAFGQSEAQAAESFTVAPNLGTAATTNTYTVTEDATGQPSGYDFRDVTCYDGATTAAPTDSDGVITGQSVDVKVEAGATVLCVYRNVKRATILVAKDQVGGSDADVFNFTAGGDLAPAGAFGQSEAQAAESFTVAPNLGTGSSANTYTVTEDATGQPSGYDFKDVTCYDGSTTAAPIDSDRLITGQSVDVKVAAGETVLCVFRNVKRATILVAKDQVGGSDADVFNFTAGGDLTPAAGFGQSEGQAAESFTVAPNLGTGSSANTYTVTEEATGQPSGYDFKDVTCYDGSTTSAATDTDRVVNGQSVDVKVAAGATVLCVYRNVKRATILIDKDQVGGADTDAFSFTRGGDLAAGSFTQAESEGSAESITVAPNLGTASTANTYTVTEDATGQPSGYDLKDITCHDGATSGDPVDTDRVVTGQSVDVKVAAGETVLCVFRNVKRATILIDKDQVGGADNDAFAFTRGGDLAAGSFTQAESEAAPESISVAPNLGTAATVNTYTVTEDATGQPAGYDLEDVTCYDGATTADPVDADRIITGQSVNVKVEAGTTVLCVFQNVKRATILVAKDQVGGSDADVFNFTAGGDLTPGGGFGQSEAQAAESFSVVPNLGAASSANTYTVTEDALGQPAGYDFKDVACYDGSSTSDPVDGDRVINGQSVDVKVAAGQTVLCVFRNVKRATILIDKDQVGGADTDAFAFTRGGDLSGSFTQAESEAGPESITVAPNLGTASTTNTYTVTEDATGQPSGYDFKELTCYDGSTTSAPADSDRVITGQSVDVKVEAGATVLCVFRNVKRSTILIDKDQVGGADTDAFAFTRGGDLSGSFTQAESEAGPESITVAPNLGIASDTTKTYTVAEDATGQPSGYDFKDLTCYDGSSTSEPIDVDRLLNGQSVGVKVAAGQTVLCVFRNVKRATILIDKDQVGGADADAFTFTRAGDLVSGSFTQAESEASPESFSIAPNLGTAADATKTYTVTEDAAGQPAGYDFQGIACYDGATTGAPADSDRVVNGRSVSVKVAAGETVLCVYTNVKRATLVVEKQTDPDETGGATFDFTTAAPGGPSSFALADDQQASRDLSPGTYTVTEGAKTGYRLSGIACDDSDSTQAGSAQAIADRKATFVLAAGETVKCTFTNTKIDASAIVVKSGNELAYHGDRVTFDFEVTNPGNSPLHDVAVTDDTCPNVTGPSKQVNGGGADELDPGDKWIYTCTMPVPHHADGEANPFRNVVTVAAEDEQGSPLSATDDHLTKILHPAIDVDKTGPAEGLAGTAIQYAIAVTNPGDVAFAADRVAVQDQLCEAPPLLIADGQRRGDGPDPSPGSLDPGDTWLYSCTVRTALGQQSVDNVADVAATDFNGRTASDADPAATVLRQPVEQSAPLRAQPGSARLQGPAACVNGPFRVTVRGRQIASVTLFVGKRKVRTLHAQQAIVLRNTKKRVLVDGKVKTVTVAQAQQTFSFGIDPRRLRRGGVHRVTARVVFTTASGTTSRRLKFAFRRCQAARQPRFTG